jgi:hypothetical protein
MAWMTTAEIKTYLGIITTDYDTQIDLYNPVAHQSGNVKSQSFDGESISYGDSKHTDNAKTSDEQLKKFKPLKKKYH